MIVKIGMSPTFNGSGDICIDSIFIPGLLDDIAGVVIPGDKIIVDSFRFLVGTALLLFEIDTSLWTVLLLVILPIDGLCCVLFS